MHKLVLVKLNCKLRPRIKGVIPVPAPLITDQIQRGKFFIGDLLSTFIFPRIEHAFHLESFVIRGRSDEVHDDLIVLQRLSFPVFADEREQRMLDLIPF